MDYKLIVIGYVLGLITTGIIILIDYLKKKKSAVYYWLKNAKKVLDFIEDFIINNPELVKEPWSKFKKKFIQKIESAMEVDWSDETWDYIFKLVYEKYKEIKKKLEEEETPTSPPPQEEEEKVEEGEG